jgi:P-type conjugative transfer protein TrbJ
MKRAFIKILLLIFLSQQAQTASVANVYTGFSSEVTQVAQFAADGVAYALDYIEQVAQYKKLVDTYKNQFTSYKLMLQNIEKLSPRQWNEFSQNVINLKHALEFGEGMSYTMANYDQEFSKLFKGYNYYLTQAKNENSDFIGTYGKLNKSTRDMANAALKSLGLQASDMQSDEATMQYLQTLSNSAKGQKSAIQAASQIALHQTHTLKKLQQTMMTQVNLQSQYMLESSEKKAFQEAISRNKATKGIKPIIGNESRVTKW